ncbi:MAG: hypothetical protein Q7R85_02405 [bacterium]|nr:hypothetical protein [bacterium]
MNEKVLSMPRIIAGVVLSLLVGGLGHIVLGFWRRGLAWFALGSVLALALSYFIPELILPNRVTLFGVTFGILAALDVWRVAELHNVAARERTENPPAEEV